MSQTLIRQELEERIKTFAANWNPPLQVSYEGLPFVKPIDNSPFLQVFLLPSRTINPTVDGVRKRMVGIFQVSVWVQDGDGNSQRRAEQIAQGVIDYFPIVPKTPPVSIEGTPYMSSPLLDSNWRIIPVTMMYRLETI